MTLRGVDMAQIRRPLGETIAELALGLMDLAASQAGRATGLEFTIPIELRFPAGAVDLVGDLPLYRRATAFDVPPAMLTVSMAEVPL